MSASFAELWADYREPPVPYRYEPQETLKLRQKALASAFKKMVRDDPPEILHTNMVAIVDKLTALDQLHNAESDVPSEPPDYQDIAAIVNTASNTKKRTVLHKLISDSSGTTSIVKVGLLIRDLGTLINFNARDKNNRRAFEDLEIRLEKSKDSRSKGKRARLQILHDGLQRVMVALDQRRLSHHTFVEASQHMMRAYFMVDLKLKGLKLKGISVSALETFRKDYYAAVSTQTYEEFLKTIDTLQARMWGFPFFVAIDTMPMPRGFTALDRVTKREDSDAKEQITTWLLKNHANPRYVQNKKQRTSMIELTREWAQDEQQATNQKDAAARKAAEMSDAPPVSPSLRQAKNQTDAAARKADEISDAPPVSPSLRLSEDIDHNESYSQQMAEDQLAYDPPPPASAHLEASNGELEPKSGIVGGSSLSPRLSSPTGSAEMPPPASPVSSALPDPDRSTAHGTKPLSPSPRTRRMLRRRQKSLLKKRMKGMSVDESDIGYTYEQTAEERKKERETRTAADEAHRSKQFENLAVSHKDSQRPGKPHQRFRCCF